MGFGNHVADTVVIWVNLVILAISLVVELLAFIDCATRRADAFPVVGRLSKAAWLVMTGGAVALTVLSGGATFVSGSFLTTILAFIAIGIALVYLLDMRPALRDVIRGGSNW
jgi:hypothetical protein